MPGKLIQCLKTSGAMNPVVLIDEIDKLGTGYRGDPASALLEVLDPSQNSSFRDHFLDVPVDISKVLFICTANELENIPGPLLDRMEVIRLSGYDFPEKVAIAQQYLVPKSMKNSGLMELPAPEEPASEEAAVEEGTAESLVSSTEAEKPIVEEVTAPPNVTPDVKQTPLDMYVHSKGVPSTLSITIDAIKSLVRWYAREAGVRNLAKYIDRITGKLALQIVAEGEGATLTEKATRKIDSWIITEENLNYYVGKPVFTKDRMYEEAPLPNGIIMGLAYTSMGGTALYIETQAIRRGLNDEGKRRGGGSLKLTGQLGGVMQESAEIAVRWISNDSTIFRNDLLIRTFLTPDILLLLWLQYTVARARLEDIDPKSSFFDEMDIHMHVPEGATPKDGPSAGITMTTSMLSLVRFSLQIVAFIPVACYASSILMDFFLY
jgi:ATP-dependent Lon protease